LSLEEKPAVGFVAEASLLRGGRGNLPADQFEHVALRQVLEYQYEFDRKRSKEPSTP
jgi:hypothetical protein